MTDDRWFLRLRPPGADPARAPAVRLVCLPHGGGSASYFVPWARALPDDAELLCVRYPGREGRFGDATAPDVATLAAELAAALRLQRPRSDGTALVLFGHSLGAVVAYEVARRLEVDLLVASGRHAPVEHRTGHLHHLGAEELLEAIEDMGGDTRALRASGELRDCMLPVIRADFRISETYHHEDGPRLGCDLMALVGDADPLVDRPSARRWAECTTGPFALHVRPGGHFYLDTQVEDVLSLVLGRTRSRSSDYDGRRAVTATSVAPTTIVRGPAK